MTAHNVVTLDPLDGIRKRISAARARATKGEAEWVEGSLELAEALQEGRERFAGDAEFGQWLRVNDVNMGKDVRAALLGFARNIELAREILTEAPSRSYDQIWRNAKDRFRDIPKASGANPNKKPPRSMKRGNIHRAMKLGDEVMNQIKDTTLDTAPEMNALIKLTRSEPEIAARLVASAAQGKDVSAIATTAELTKQPAPPAPELVEAFRKRMTYIWQRADHAAQSALIDYLMHHMKDS